MKKKFRLSKFIKRLLLSLAVLSLIVAGLLYYIVIHNFKESIQFIVTSESKGKYEFDAGRATVSLKRKEIIFKNASLHCLDTTNIPVHYEIQIPDLDFSFTSWRDIIFNKKLKVNNLTLVRPYIKVHAHQLRETDLTKNKNFKPSDILVFLDKTLEHFNVKLFTIKDATFVYSRRNGPSPFVADKINFSLSNFSKVDNNDAHLFGSDNITLQLGKQHWILPDGKQELSFNQLNFFSKGQRFEVDSFSYKRYETIDEGEMKFTAAKFFFNSQHLPALYQKEQLLIDTLYFLNPKLSVIEDKKSTKELKKDSVVHETPDDYFFKLIKINFISILDAELQINKRSNDARKKKSDKNNIFIYNLTVNNEEKGLVSTDSVKINLNAMEFYNKDSLFKIRINNFSLDNNAAILKGVSYGPSELNPSKDGIHFSAPSFILNDIDIPELIKGHIKASNAVLSHPVIVISEKKRNTINQIDRKKRSAIKESNLIKSLHEVNDLIDVAGLDIRNGTIHFKGAGPDLFKLDVNDINAKFQLNEIFEIDQLPDIEDAISWIIAKEIILSFNDVKAQIWNYHFEGSKRMSRVDQFMLTLKNGSQIKGNDLSWKLFNWKYFQKTNRIKMDWLTLNHLSVNLKESLGEQNRKPQFPLMDIGRFSINQFEFSKNNSINQFQFTGDQLQIDNLQSSEQLFSWNKIIANINHLTQEGKDNKLSVEKIEFFSDQESSFENINFQSKNEFNEVKIEVPLLKLYLGLTSTDISKLKILTIYTDKGSINYTVFSKNENSSTVFSIPIPILIQNIDLNNFALIYSSFNNSDTISLESNLDISGKNWELGNAKNELLAFKNTAINLSATNFYKPNLWIEIPQTTLQFHDAKMQNNDVDDLSFSSDIQFEWKNASVKFAKDSLLLSGNQLDGYFTNPNFNWKQGQKINWINWVGQFKTNGKNIQFQNKKLSINANQLIADGFNKKLLLVNFEIDPKQSREESFATAKWQNDFLELTGDSLTVSDIRYTNSIDTLLRIRSIKAVGINVDLSRDKKIPFQHGIEKKMPTKLIQSISFPIKVDSVLFRNSHLNYNEFSMGTNQWATVPLRKLDVELLNFSTDKKEQDSLTINIQSYILEGPIRQFSYKESYADSLSGFVAENHLSAFDMVHLSKLSHPMAGAFIVRGKVDTMYAKWTGNKYAALGTMNFHYKNLKIKLMDREDISKQGFGSSLKTFFANLILPSQKSKPSIIYFRRDRERFIFNYWIKTQTSGFLSTLGVKSNRKYIKQYEEDKLRYSLPPFVFK